MQANSFGLNFIQLIGKGNFGEVYLTKINGDPGLYATKKLDRKVCERPPLLDRLINEINILQNVNHPNIVKFKTLKKTQNNWYIVTEYINGDSLTNNLKRYMSLYNKTFPEDIVQHIMRQIVDALQYLHFNKIVHRDLKLDNILVSYPTEYDKQNLNLKNCQVKIIDFGFAKVLRNQFTNTLLGTAPNMDPQILGQFATGQKTGGYNETVDIWSLGTLCYEMVVGYSPFSGINMQDLYQKVKKGNYALPSSLSDELVTFINGMLQVNPNQRLNINQLKNHKFLVNPVSTFHRVEVKNIKASYIPGGMLKMKSNEPQENIVTNNNDIFDLWRIFSNPNYYNEYGNNLIPVQVQQEPQIQQVVQVQNYQPQPQIQQVVPAQNYQLQPKIQPKMQMPNYQQYPKVQVQPQPYPATKVQKQQQYYYNQPQTNYDAYY